MIRQWTAPAASELGESVEEFVRILAGPTLLRIKGKDSSRLRAISTLLHGNEPSGIKAIFRWLKEGSVPCVDILVFVASVDAALAMPGFFLRHLAHQRDLNRCFNPPFDDEPGKIAEAMLAILHDEKPEALVDIHNTSGSGPSFAVTITNDKEHRALTSLFTQRLIHTDLRLGAIMEFSENDVPTVTIECGGAQDDEAHEIAYEGINRFISEENVLTEQETDWGLELLENPIRIELKEDVTIAFEEKAKVNTDITLPPSIENHNFGIISPGQPLGWLGERGLDCFVVKNTLGENKLTKVLREEAGVLYVAQPIRAFMITTNADIAKSDCLFYAVADHGGAIS
ncbi:MAG: succinylglutamate desuccinylase [Moraxellaceae bacterium]|nr:MAG: succinylglutamate desuccinylase [Moraxellaceae bacterium]